MIPLFVLVLPVVGGAELVDVGVVDDEVLVGVPDGRDEGLLVMMVF